MKFSISGKHLSDTILTLLVCFIAVGNLYAVQIQKVHFIQAEGNIEFRIEHATNPQTVHWYAVRHSIDEENFQSISSSDTIQALGASVSFTLKTRRKEITYYKIVAFDGGEADSLGIQVCKTGVVQKYVYENNPVTNKPLPVWIVLPRTFSSDSKFLMAMTGHHRNAVGYAKYWSDFANSQNYIIAVPEFNPDDWPTSAYNLGNMFTGKEGAGSLNDTSKWSFRIAAEIHTEIALKCGLTDSTYQIWGFSGGGQFVHRLAMFLPDPFITRYFACDAGWYTCPELQRAYPYELKHRSLHYTEANIKAYTELPVVLLCGMSDVERDKELKIDIKADMEGDNRLSRSEFFYKYIKKLNPNTTWEYITVPDIAHEARKMAKFSGDYIARHPLK